MQRSDETTQEVQDTVAIIGGTGKLGFGLALRWAIAGVAVTIGSRQPEAAAQAAARVVEAAASTGASGTLVEGVVNGEAAQRSRTVVLSVPFQAQVETLKEISPALEAGTTLVDATVPLATALGGKPTQTIGLWQGSAAQRAAELLPPSVTVVSALHSVSARALQDPSKQIDEDVLICGDDAAAKLKTSKLIQQIPNLRPVDCGDLEMSKITEQITALLISVNGRYKVEHSGVRITGLRTDL